MLLIAFDEALVHRLTNIGLTITVSVFSIENFRSHRDDHATSPTMNTVGKRKVVEERCGFVVNAVFVSVFEHLYATCERQGASPRCRFWLCIVGASTITGG